MNFNALSGTVTTTTHDNAIALEWRNASLANGATWTIGATEKYSNKTITSLTVTAPINETIAPGQTKNITFQVTNNSASTVSNISLTDLIDLAGWTATITAPVGTFSLAAGASQSVTVSVFCVGTAVAGDVAKVTLNASEPSPTTANDVAYVTVVAPAATEFNVSGTLKYDNVAQSGLGNQTVNLMNGATLVQTTTTNASGNYSFPVLVPNGSYTIEPNVTLNRKAVTAMDATLYRKHIVGSTVLTGLKLVSGDATNSSTLTAADLTEILERIVTTRTSFTAGDWAYSDGAVTVSGAAISVNLQAICYGDANGSYIYTGTKSVLSTLPNIPAQNNKTLYFNNNDVFEIPVKAVYSIANLSSVTLVMTYDPALVDVTEVVMATNASNMKYSVNNGVIKIAYSTLNATSFQDNDILFYIRGKVLNLTSSTNIFSQANGEFGNSDDNVIGNIVLSAPTFATATVTGITNLKKEVQYTQILPETL